MSTEVQKTALSLLPRIKAFADAFNNQIYRSWFRRVASISDGNTDSVFANGRRMSPEEFLNFVSGQITIGNSLRKSVFSDTNKEDHPCP